MRKNKKLTRKDYVKQLDSIFSTYIRLRDCDDKWIVVCPLCWARIDWKKSQNMHFITRGCRLYRYDEDNCHAWCMRCNVILHGNYIVYTRYMQKTYGIEKVDYMIKSKTKIFKISTPELVDKIKYYTDQAADISRKKGIFI